jgi:hypothetical protein
MRKVAEYERRADECRKIATQMKDPEQKKQLEVMAQAWDLLARTRLKQLQKASSPHRIAERSTMSLLSKRTELKPLLRGCSPAVLLGSHPAAIAQD